MSVAVTEKKNAEEELETQQKNNEILSGDVVMQTLLFLPGERLKKLVQF